MTKGGRLKADEAYEKKPISPSKAEKLLKDRPKIWSKIAPLITQDNGKPSVAPESDPRPAIQIASAVEDFADLSQETIHIEVLTVSSTEIAAGDAPAPSVDDLMA